MITVVARPYDDHSIVEVYQAEHSKLLPSPHEIFEHDWDEATIEAKKKNPETWCVDEVIKKLEKKGWKIICCNTVVVTY